MRASASTSPNQDAETGALGQPSLGQDETQRRAGTACSVTWRERAK